MLKEVKVNKLQLRIHDRNYQALMYKCLTIIIMKKPTIELKSTKFTEVIELDRKVTPDKEKRVDHVFVRRIKVCKRHPEGFATEEYARFEIAWPEELKEEIKKDIQEEISVNSQ